MKSFLKFAVLAALVVLFAGQANAQLTANGNVAVQVVVTQQSIVTLTTSGGSLTFDPSSGQTNSINFQVGWNLPDSWSSVKLYTYFSSANAALSTSGGANIPSSQIAASISGGNASGPVSGQACSNSYGQGNGIVDGASCQVFTVASATDGVDGGRTGNSPKTITYSLSLLGYANNGLHLAAGQYSGVLNALALAI